MVFEYIDIADEALLTSNSSSTRLGVVELIVGAVVFLSVVSVYNALFSIWESLIKTQPGRANEYETELDEKDDVIIRVTYSIFVIFISCLILLSLGYLT